MFTVKENSTYQYEIKKSKFITLLYQVQNIEEVNQSIEEVKKNYKEATHYCYAYKIGNEQKFSDDNEPSGTAGLPMMEVLNKKNLDYILCIVVRYFGGIKLGAGGLSRAYTKAVTEAIKNNVIIELEEGYLIELEATYEEQKQIEYLFANQIQKKEFREKVIYDITISKQDIHLLKDYPYQIQNEIMIEKY